MKEKIKKCIQSDNIDLAKELIFQAINSQAATVTDAEIYALLGLIYAMENKNELALQYFSEAYSVEPNNYEVVSLVCNFLIANNAKNEANQLMDKFLKEQNDISSTEEVKNETISTEFDYMDFILNNKDALAYQYTPDLDTTNGTHLVNQNVDSSNSLQEQGFSYEELIINDDINSILEKYNLPKIKTTSQFQNTNIEEVQLAIDTVKPTTVKPKLLFTMYGWNESGGGTTHPKAIVTELAKRGYEVAVFYATARHSGNTTPYFMEKTVENDVKLYGIYNRPTVFLDIDNPLREICDKQIISLFNTVIDEFQPNIINFHNFLGLSFEMATVAKSRNIPTTFTTHNYHILDPKLYIYNNDMMPWKSTDFFENSDLPHRYPMLKEDYKLRVEKAKSLLTKDIDYVFAVSSRVKELLSEFIGVDFYSADNKICVINQVPNSVSSLLATTVKHHYKANDTIRFAFIGDSHPHKGAHLIPQAAQFLIGKNISFDIWGNFDNDYGKAIKSIDSANIISLKGQYSGNDLRKIAEQSDVAIATSICEETGPLVLPEYLAMNLPVVASKIGGVDDFIVEGYNGTLFKAGAPKALASVIQALIDNPFKIEKMRNNCRIPYSFSYYIDHLEAIFKTIVSGKRPLSNEFNLIFAEKLWEK